jgi:hypothetical protein
MAMNESRTKPAAKLKFDEILEWIEEEVAAPPKAPSSPSASPSSGSSANTLVRLPVWPEATRAVPNGVLRSALFGVIQRGARRYLKVEPVAALEGIEIFYTGEQLDQGDLDVWLAVLHLCRAQTMGEKCGFTAYELLKLLGKGNTGGKRGNRKVLDGQLNRLHAALVRVKVGRYSYSGHLIHDIVRDHKTKRYEVVLNPKLRGLFELDQFTQLEWAVRQQLDGKPLAQWLHGFFSSHAAPLPISVGKLRELCGSEIGRERAFKEKLRKALEAVADACEEHGQPFRFGFDGDLVRVERTPSAAQRRHLTKRAPKPSR